MVLAEVWGMRCGVRVRVVRRMRERGPRVGILKCGLELEVELEVLGQVEVFEDRRRR